MNVQDLIEVIIDEFIDELKPFTAYQVTLEARSRGVKERHLVLRDMIHASPRLFDELNNGGYHKKLHRWTDASDGKQYEAYLYYPHIFDPDDYCPLSRTQNTAPTPPAATPDDGRHSFDYRNRLLVPTACVREVAKPGETVHVFGDNGSVYLTKAEPQGRASSIKVVEKNGDIRVYQSVLEDCGLRGDDFLIENVNYQGSPAVQISV